MSANDRRINQERLVVLVLGEFFEYSSPHTLSCPSRETRVDGLPLGVVLRQIAPWSAGPENPADRVDDLPVVDAWTAFASCLRGQNLANPLPLLRSQLMPSSHPRSSSPSGARWKSSRYSLRTRPSTTSTKTKAAALAHVQALIAGTTKHFPNGSFTIGGTVYTAASLIQVFQGLASAMTARNAAEAGAKDALAAEHAAQTQVGPILLAYKRLVHAAFANATQTLADFGLAPPKTRTPLTTEQRAARAAKAKATRTARGTTSKKQKLAVKGNVTGVTVTPVTAPTAATPPAAPVPR